MAIRSADENTTINPVSQQVYQQDTTTRPFSSDDPLFSPQYANRAPAMHELLDQFRITKSIGKEEEDYIDSLTKILCDKTRTFHLDIKRPANPAGTVIFSHRNQVGIALVFEKTVEFDDPNVPAAMIIAEINRQAVAEFGTNFKLLNTIIVATEDLKYYQKMAEHIASCIKMDVSNIWGNFTEDNLKNDMFTINTDITAFNRFVEDISPHGIKSRADVGFTLQLKKPQSELGIGNSNSSRTIAAVAAFTDLIEVPDPTGMAYIKYLPFIRITDMYSALPSIKIVPMLIALAIENFHVKGQWKNQFMNLAKKQANIGNLSANPNNQSELWFADTKEKVHEYINYNCLPPVIGLDITEGRARIPGLERFALANEAPYLQQEFSSFLKTNLTTDQFVSISFDEYNGYVSAREMLDSRCVDYLNLAKDMTLEQAQAARDLLRKKQNPELRVNKIREFIPEFRKLFITCTCEFNERFVSEVSAAVQRLNIQSNVVASGDIDMSGAIKRANAFASIPNMIVTSPFNGHKQVGGFTAAKLFGIHRNFR